MTLIKIKKPIKLGIIGCGRVAAERHLPSLACLKKIEVVAAADINPERLLKIADRYKIKHRFIDYRDLLKLKELEAVGILTPTQSHAEIGKASLEAGKHILIEKPLALNLNECDQLIACAANSNAKIVVGFNLRWHRLVRRAHALIRSGILGRIKAIRSVYTHYRSGELAPEWHRILSLGGGVSINEAVHHFDLWRYLLQNEVTRIFSFNCASEYYQDETHVTNAVMSDGVLATGVFTYKTSPNSEIEVYGELGRLYISCYKFDGLEFFSNAVYPGDVAYRVRKTINTLRTIPNVMVSIRHGGDFAASFYNLWSHFIDCIRYDKPCECTLEDGKSALRLALASIESVSSGKQIDLTDKKIKMNFTPQ